VKACLEAMGKRTIEYRLLAMNAVLDILSLTCGLWASVLSMSVANASM
jgi:hypothetical protein